MRGPEEALRATHVWLNRGTTAFARFYRAWRGMKSPRGGDGQCGGFPRGFGKRTVGGGQGPGVGGAASASALFPVAPPGWRELRAEVAQHVK